MENIRTFALKSDFCIGMSRHAARELASALAFDDKEQVRIAAAVSEIARCFFRQTSGAQVAFGLSETAAANLVVEASGKVVEREALARIRNGLIGAERLVGPLGVYEHEGIVTATLVRPLPHGRTVQDFERVRDLPLVEEAFGSRHMVEDMHRQNQELLAALDELRASQLETGRLNRELDETNRGVLALYAEIADKAAALKRASDLKSLFLSNVSHEFRTPLNSILVFTKLLTDRIAGDLAPDQEKQVLFIRKAAEELSGLVNDLLDLAKIEAGKVSVRPSAIEASAILAALRGMFRSHAATGEVELVIEEPVEDITLDSDEAKISQILRNLIANALKFTLTGEIRVAVERHCDQMVCFTVRDTGIGIDPKDHDLIFEEFAQVENERQRQVKGTGLGLPLSRRLAEVLGGKLWVESALGQGATFHFLLPCRYVGPAERAQQATEPERASGRAASAKAGSLSALRPGCRALVIDDTELTREALKMQLASSSVVVLEACDGKAGLEMARCETPDIIILDLLMPGLSGFDVLEELRRSRETSRIPVIVHTSKDLDAGELQRLDALDAAVVAKSVDAPELIWQALERALTKQGASIHLGQSVELREKER